MRAALALTALLGCRAAFQFAPPVEGGAPPLADAGTGTTVRVDSVITLDATGSTDPDGMIWSYHWQLESAPPESTASLVGADSSTTTFTPDATGDYVFDLEVVDDSGLSDQSSVTFHVIPHEVDVHAGSDVAVEWRARVQLAGTVNAEGSESPVLTWSFVSRPSRSTAVLVNASTLTPSFTADAAGTYVLELTASTSLYTGSDTVTVTATVQQVTFQGAFIDAVFDSDEDRLVAISDSPPRVRFINPADGTETSIALPSTPTALSMDQYENSLAVTTSGKVHIIDLFSQTLTGSYTVPFTASHVVFGPFGLVHCFTAQAGPVQTLDVSSGQVTPSSVSVSAGTIGTLKLNENVMYTVDTSISPADLTDFAVNVAPIERLADSPYAGEYALGGNLWVLSDLIFVRAGNVFNSAQYMASDMTYRGHLDGDGPATVEYAFSNFPKVITLHSLAASPPNYQLRAYDRTSLALLDSAPLPDIVVNGVPQPSTGRLIAYSPGHPNKIVAVASAGASNAFFVTTP